jgi:hypothetical protein
VAAHGVLAKSGMRETATFMLHGVLVESGITRSSSAAAASTSLCPWSVIPKMRAPGSAACDPAASSATYGIAMLSSFGTAVHAAMRRHVQL